MNNVISLFQRWLQGGLNREENHLLEKEALDSEFIGDALEGLTLYHPEGRDKLPDHLSQRLKKQKMHKEGRVIRLWPYAIAASMVLLLSFFFLLRDTEQKHKEDSLVADVTTFDEMESSEVASYAEPEIEVDEMEMEPQSEPKTALPSAKPLMGKPEKPQSAEGLSTAAESTPLTTAPIEETPVMAINKKSEKGESSATAEKIKLGESAPTKSQVTTLTRKVTDPANPADEIMTSPSTEVQKPNKLSLTRTLDQNSGARPIIGDEAFIKILKDNPVPKEWLFMRGLKSGDTFTIQFELDPDGLPINIKGRGYPEDILNKIIKASGQWTAPDSIRVIEYPLRLFAK